MALVGKQFPNITVDAISDMGDYLRINVLEEATKNNKKVILFWYPKDFTFVCPTELHAFQAALQEFEKRNKEFIIRFKKRCKCIKCSLDKWYLIEFHHLDPSKKYKSVTALQFNAYSIKTIKEEVRKCVPICRNCHMEFHYLERQKIVCTFEEYLKLDI